MTCAVVIATFNGEKYIEDQLHSIVRQSRKPDYIIVTDDNSQDMTVAICNKILSGTEMNYQIIINGIRQNVTNNFFSGIEKVEQDIIFFSDQDDIWIENKIEKMMAVFEMHPDCTEVLCDAFIWSKQGIQKKTLLETLKKQYPVYDKEGLVDKNSFWYVAINRNIATGMSMAIKKTAVAYKRQQGLLMYHDAWFNLISAAQGNVYVLNEPLAYYRQHDNNVEGIRRKVSFEAIRNCISKTIYSMRKKNERYTIINELDKKFNLLEEANRQCLERMMALELERESYILNNKFCKMVLFTIRNRAIYPATVFMIRDLVVCILFKYKDR